MRYPVVAERERERHQRASRYKEGRDKRETDTHILIKVSVPLGILSIRVDHWPIAALAEAIKVRKLCLEVYPIDCVKALHRRSAQEHFTLWRRLETRERHGVTTYRRSAIE